MSDSWDFLVVILDFTFRKLDKTSSFLMFPIQMVSSSTVDKDLDWPYENQNISILSFKMLTTEFKWFHYSNVLYSDPHCIPF